MNFACVCVRACVCVCVCVCVNFIFRHKRGHTLNFRFRPTRLHNSGQEVATWSVNFSQASSLSVHTRRTPSSTLIIDIQLNESTWQKEAFHESVFISVLPPITTDRQKHLFLSQMLPWTYIPWVNRSMDAAVLLTAARSACSFPVRGRTHKSDI